MTYKDTPSRIIGESWDTKVIIEKNTSELTIQEYVDMCFSVLVGLSFSEEMIVEAMQEFIEQKKQLC